MATILGLVLVAVIAAVLWRNRTRSIDPSETRPTRTFFGVEWAGAPLEKLSDPRLLATILMQQLVRTGAPVTAAEKTEILAQMAHPLDIADRDAMWDKAWAYTDLDRSFEALADDLLPTLRAHLDEGQKTQLIAMLRKVAAAYGEPSQLQVEAIDRLERRLEKPAAAPAA